MTTDIRLPRHVTPRWPGRCVGCGAADPGQWLERRTRTLGWWSLGGLLPALAWLTRGRLFETEAPICGPCHTRARRHGLLEWVVILALLIPVVVLVAGPLQGDSQAANTALKIGSILLVLVPFGLWRALRPPAFDVTAFAEHVEYEFRDPAYAADFARLNDLSPGDGPDPDAARGS